MANRKKEDQGKRINLQLPTADYDAANNMAAKRKQSISEFIRRAVDFQAWLETMMPDVEGFGADELAKITLARKQLAELEDQRLKLLNERAEEEIVSPPQATSNGGATSKKNTPGGTGETPHLASQ